MRAASACEKSLLEGISLKVLCANPGKLLGEVMEHDQQSVGPRKTAQLGDMILSVSGM